MSSYPRLALARDALAGSLVDTGLVDARGGAVALLVEPLAIDDDEADPESPKQHSTEDVWARAAAFADAEAARERNARNDDGAMELDELDKWFRTNSRVLWPKGAEAPPDFDMEAWLRAHGSRAGVVVFTRQGLKREILMVKIETWVKPAKKQKTAPPAPRPPGKPKPKKADVMKKGRQKRKHSPAGGSQSKKGKSDSDDFIPM